MTGQDVLPTLNEWASLGCQFWVFVTKPDYYLADPDDLNSEDKFGPEDIGESDDPEDYTNWIWSCHKDTKQGDLIYLYRTAPKKNIKYVLLAMSDAYPMPEENYEPNQPRWKWVCDIRFVEIFENPVSFNAMRKDPVLREWQAVKCSMQKSEFRMSPEQWHRVYQLAYCDDIALLHRPTTELSNYSIPKEFKLENEIEDIVEEKLPELFREDGYDLELFIHNDGRRGRQFWCHGMGGRIDLLALDKKTGTLVVIEIKKDRAGRDVQSQIYSYIGYVKKHLADGRTVMGFVICRETDIKFDYAASISDDIKIYEYPKLFAKYGITL